MANEKKPHKNFVRSMALGPEYSREKIIDAINESNLSYKEVPEIRTELVDIIQSNLVVGLFRGRMEFGPLPAIQTVLMAQKIMQEHLFLQKVLKNLKN